MAQLDNRYAQPGMATGVAVDEGLRSYMLSVYNYMASAVALTGVVAYLTFTMSVVTNSAGAITGFTPLGQFLFGGRRIFFSGKSNGGTAA